MRVTSHCLWATAGWMLCVLFSSLIATAAVEQCLTPFLEPEVKGPFNRAICNAPERSHLHLSVTVGSIPDWLHGTIYRNVPAQFSFGSDQLQHWFDGMSQIQSYTLGEKGVDVHSRFMNTTSWQTLSDMNFSSFPFVGFGTPAFPGPLFPPAAPAAKPNFGFANNNDVNILYVGGRYFATSDDTELIEFDGDTLETLTPDKFQFNDTLDQHGGFGLAHGSYDYETDEYFNYLQDPSGLFHGEDVKTTMFKLNSTELMGKGPGAWKRRPVGVVETTRVHYSHSLGLSKNFVVWLQLPIIYDMEALMFGWPIIDAMQDISAFDQPVIHLVSRENGTVMGSANITMPGFGCVMHTGNVFEDDDGSVVYDAVRYSNCSVYRALFLREMLGNPTESIATVQTGRLVRCRSWPGLSEAVCQDLLLDVPAGFPWYNRQFHMKPYRYVYTTQIAGSEGLGGEVRKFDLKVNQTVARFAHESLLLTEAIFVPKDPSQAPHPSNEEDGALLTIAFNQTSGNSQLFALDPHDLQPIFVVDFPFANPIHFHGIFCRPKPKHPLQRRFCLWN